MTSMEAAKILERPRFGNQVCIDAIRVMQMAKETLQARQWALEPGITGLWEEPRAEISLMQHEALEDELGYWHECGWRQA